MASPYMSRPFRHMGRWVLGIGAIAGVALGTTFPIGMVAGFAVGIGSAAAVHLLFGSPAGRLTLDQVAGALADLDVEATGLRQEALQPRGAAVLMANDPAGRSLLVKIYGRDAWDGQLLASVWTSLWYRGDSAHLALGRREQVEHEAFLTLLAERGGVSVLPVVAAGMASENDALLVTEVTGRPLATLGADEVDGGLLGGIWDNAAVLRDLGIAHGRLDGSHIVIRPDGSAAFGNFSGAEVAASETTSPPTGRASWWRRHCRWASIAPPWLRWPRLGPEGLGQVLPLLQPAAFDRQVRRMIADGDWSLDDLRKACATAAGVEVPKLAQIRRVSLQRIGVVALIALVAYALISSVANVGLSNLVDEFQSADLSWLAGGAGVLRRGPRGAGLRDARSDVSTHPIPSRPHARVRHSIHRARHPQLCRAVRPGRAVLRAQRGGGRGRDLDRSDRWFLRVRDADRAHPGDQPVGPRIVAIAGVVELILERVVFVGGSSPADSRSRPGGGRCAGDAGRPQVPEGGRARPFRGTGRCSIHRRRPPPRHCACCVPRHTSR